MAVTELNYTIIPEDGGQSIQDEWGHAGIVGSGDLEVLIEKSNIAGAVFHINTKVTGFDEVWEAVIKKFAATWKLSGVAVDINDNAATPAVVIKRLQQAVKAAGGLKEAGK